MRYEDTYLEDVRNLLTNNYYLRPIITINGNFEMSGDGTINNPYQYK